MAETTGYSAKGDKTIFLVIFGYLIFALCINWPLLGHFSSWIAGGWQYNDAPFFIWNFWWVKDALLNFNNPLVTDVLYWPQNVNLTLHTLALLPSVISIPLQLFFNLITTYNILYILTFALSGTGTYLLVNLLTNNRIAAIISGIIFAFNPYIFAHAMAGHFNLINSWPIPFFAYFLFRSMDDDGYKNTIYAALVLTFQSYLDFHYLLYLIIFAFLFLIWHLTTNKNRLPVLKKLLLGSLIWFILFLPILVPTYGFYKDTNYNNWLENDYYPQKASFENTDLASYYNFSTSHPIFGDNFLEKMKIQTGGITENNVFLGYTVMILALLGLVFSKDKLEFFWLIVFLVFFSLSLGNSLQIDGKIYYDLPYGLIKKYLLPNLDIVASRFVMMTYLSLAVLSAFFINSLLRIIKNNKLKYALGVVLLLLITFEYFPTLAVDKLETSPIYIQIGQDKGNYNLLVVPETSKMTYYQTIHGKNLVGGYSGRRTHEYNLSYYSKTPGLRVLLLNIKADDGDLNKNVVLEKLNDYNIKYIIIDKKVPFANRDYMISYLEKDLNLNLFYQDELVKVYEIK